MALDDFAPNLRLACGFERSISEVCRRIGINRQQFNRYLSGQSRPSRFNMNRICAHFGLEPAQFYLSPPEFEAVLAPRRDQAGMAGFTTEAFGPLFEQVLPRQQKALRLYHGFYHSYFKAFGWEGYIMRSLIHLYEHQGRTYAKAIERVRDPVRGDRFVSKYLGLVTLLADRIFILETESLKVDGLFLTVLYKTYRSRVGFLSGLTMGISTRSGREPAASRVVYEFLGKTVDHNVTLRACGLLHANNDTINPRIKSLIDNTLGEGEASLMAKPV